MSPALSIYHEDDAVAVIEKPAGMACLPPSPHPSPPGGEGGRVRGAELCLADLLIQRWPALVALPDAGLVHRLDNDTSGLIIVAKTQAAYAHLRKQFEAHAVEKGYLALVIGNPSDHGVIDKPIAHHPRKKKKMVVCESAEKAEELKARPATTRFQVLERYGGSCRYALLQVSITTGVRHQIRTHLASIGSPLAGDRLYQNPKKRAEDTLLLTRHFLHASRIVFEHPLTGKQIECTSGLPLDLQDVLHQLTASTC